MYSKTLMKSLRWPSMKGIETLKGLGQSKLFPPDMAMLFDQKKKNESEARPGRHIQRRDG